MGMPKRRLALIALILISVLGILLVFLMPKSASKVNLRLVKAAREGGAVVVSFEVTDGTGREYGLTAVRLETKEDDSWKKSPAPISGFFDAPLAGVHTIARSSFFFPRQSSGSRLRLVVNVQRARRGIDSFWTRLKLRISGQARGISLNPFDTTSLIYTKESTDIATEEFAQP